MRYCVFDHGDTVTVLREKTPVKVRLNGIDCPETGQPFGSKAKEETSELVFGKSVRVITRDAEHITIPQTHQEGDATQ